MDTLVLLATVAVSSALLGSLGMGVAFAAIPLLGLVHGDLANEIQPMALFLNGLTAVFAAAWFSHAGLVDWTRAAKLSIVATLFSPLGALLALHLDPGLLWASYFLVVAGAVFILLLPREQTSWHFDKVLLACAPITTLAGLVGVGPGLLLVPLIIRAGFHPRRAASMSVVAAVPASFAALVPHISGASVEPAFALPVCACAAAGACVGGYLSSTGSLREEKLRPLLIALILSLALFKAFDLYGVTLETGEKFAQCSRPDEPLCP